MPWTEEQEKVIASRGGDLLVAAAAGSGKTAVLVERILTMIQEEPNSMELDRMLIVTFTKAAAAEMKERIGNAIEKKLREQPENEHLRKQSALLPKAQISTIHSFCLQLIRDHFNVLGIDPSFRMLDEGESQLMKSDVLKEVLEQFYEEGSEDFHLLVEGYTSGKSDVALEDLTKKLYEFARSNPEPDVWLCHASKRFTINSIEELEQSPYMEELLSCTRQMVQEVLEKNSLALRLSRKPAGPLAYEKTLLQDQSYLESLAECKTYKSYQEAMLAGGFTRLSGRPAKETDASLKSMVKQLRDEGKEQLKSWIQQYYQKTEEQMLEEVFMVKKPMQALIRLTQAFAEGFARAKQQKNVMDFGDLEHYTLKLLVSGYDEKGQAIPTKLAVDLSHSYDEIFIDEYQDSNLIQEAILSSISGLYSGKKNRFMVGDVKQSIYRFRLARPEIFMEKYNLYGQKKDEKKIELHKNFRSRASVLEATNLVFEQLMGEDLGGVLYNKEVALITGRTFPEKQGLNDKTEVLILETGESDYTKKELEAHAIAQKIHEMMGEENPYYVFDEHLGENGDYRKVCYRDIVILLRTVSGWGEVLEDVLAEEGIPAHSDSQKGYFSALEVQQVLNLLMVVDNRYQDIPMAAVLRSPMVGMSGEELAYLKAIYGGNRKREQALYHCLCFMAEDELEEIKLEKDLPWQEQLKEKVIKFLELLEELEYAKTCISIHDLIWFAWKKTGYFYYVGAMPQGKKRQANLLMLLEKANQYENASYKGLFHFIRYINQLREYEIDFGEASILGEQEDVVRIMSIHKSKGLEFPVVFVGELSKPFNFMDLRQKLLIHAEDYLGPDYMNIETRRKKATWMKLLMQRKLKEETLGEELRVLYVAMTRAKEKLFLVGTVEDYEKKREQFSYVRYQQDGKDGTNHLLARSIRAGGSCFLDWILAVLAIPQEQIQVHVISEKELVFREVGKGILHEEKKEEFKKLYEKKKDSEQTKWIQERFSYSYPYKEEVEARSKYSVSELKKLGQAEEGEDYFTIKEDFLDSEKQRKEEDNEEILKKVDVEKGLNQKREIVEDRLGKKRMMEEERIRPAFMMETIKEESGASRGTQIHKVLEYLDFSILHTKESICAYFDSLVHKNIITEEQRQYLPLKGVLILVKSEIGKRMQYAAKEGKLHKESQYMMGLPVKEWKKDSESEELVLLQGMIDVWFEEEDGLVLVDYKTDRVSDEQELLKRYQIQMEYYKKALEQLTGKPVKESYLYSFALKCAILVV